MEIQQKLDRVRKHKSLSNTFNNGYQKLSILQRINPAYYTR